MRFALSGAAKAVLVQRFKKPSSRYDTLRHTSCHYAVSMCHVGKTANCDKTPENIDYIDVLRCLFCLTYYRLKVRCRSAVASAP